MPIQNQGWRRAAPTVKLTGPTGAAQRHWHCLCAIVALGQPNNSVEFLPAEVEPITHSRRIGLVHKLWQREVPVQRLVGRKYNSISFLMKFCPSSILISLSGLWIMSCITTPSSCVSTDHLIPFHWEFAAYIFQPLTPGFWIVWVQKNKECMLFAVPASMHQKQFSRQGFHLIYFEILQELWIL